MLAGTVSCPGDEMCPRGSLEVGLQNKDDDNEDEPHIPLHAFPLLVRVPCFLLESTVLTSGKESLTGIAKSSLIDDTREELLYRVHLESGHFLEINVGFLEIIFPDPQEHEADTQPA
jgi:hypothetical protein